MNLNAIGSLATSYLHPAARPTGNTFSHSSEKPSASSFADMLQSSAGNSSPSSASTSSTPSQLLSQLMASYQTSGVQNQSQQSLDPMSIL